MFSSSFKMLKLLNSFFGQMFCFVVVVHSTQGQANSPVLVHFSAQMMT
jgi:hypothetical protein